MTFRERFAARATALSRNVGDEYAYTPVAGGPVIAFGKLDRDYIEALGVASTDPRLEVLSSDVPTPTRNDQVNVGGVDFVVVEVQPTGRESYVLQLKLET